MEKNKIYHRAGVYMKDPAGWQLVYEDLARFGKAGMKAAEKDISKVYYGVHGKLGSSHDNYLLDTVEKFGYFLGEQKFSTGWQHNTNSIIVCQPPSNGEYYLNNQITGVAVDMSESDGGTCGFIIGEGVYRNGIDTGQVVQRFVPCYGAMMYCYEDSIPQSTAPIFLKWNIAITDYGSVYSIGRSVRTGPGAPYETSRLYINKATSEVGTDLKTVLPNNALNCFFTYCVNINDETKKYPALVWVGAVEPKISSDSMYSQSNVFILTPALEIGNIEKIPDEYFSAARGKKYSSTPTLVNLTAKSGEIIFPHLYVKTIPNENLFGHIKMGNKEFIAGSYLCLECGQGGTFNEQ